MAICADTQCEWRVFAMALGVNCIDLVCMSLCMLTSGILREATLSGASVSNGGVVGDVVKSPDAQREINRVERQRVVADVIVGHNSVRACSQRTIDANGTSGACVRQSGELVKTCV